MEKEWRLYRIFLYIWARPEIARAGCSTLPVLILMHAVCTVMYERDALKSMASVFAEVPVLFCKHE